MKKTLLFAAALLAFAACEGNVDNPGQNGGQTPPDNGGETPPVEIPEEFEGPYTLKADKTEVEASGEDYVTFSLLDAYGRDVLADRKALQNVNIVSEEGPRVPRMETQARFIANGTYTYKARFQGQDSENTVAVVAQNRGKYEKFHRNVAIYKATATWCQYCPSMTRALEGMNEDTKNHSIELCWHSGDEVSIKFPGSANDCGSLVAALLNDGQVALPTVVLDLHKLNMERSSSALETAIWDLRAKYPATCGIKASAEATDGELRIEAELTSSTGGEYDLGCAVLLNDQILPGGTAVDEKYTHIVCATTGNYLMHSKEMQKVGKDASVPYEQIFEIGSADAGKLSVVVFALVDHEGAARIDNIVEVKVGESIDYVYNE